MPRWWTVNERGFVVCPNCRLAMPSGMCDLSGYHEGGCEYIETLDKVACEAQPKLEGRAVSARNSRYGPPVAWCDLTSGRSPA